ncbi:MAG: DUF1592 domain-containing protein [Verrucomicrobiota bacterium]
MSFCLVCLFGRVEDLSADPGDLRDGLEDFLWANCYDCHDDLRSEAELDLTQLDWDPSDPDNQQRWVRIFKRVEAGEMPPREAKEHPSQESVAAFLGDLKSPLVAAVQARNESEGRVTFRRMTRRQHERTIQDLLGIAIPLQGFLPDDAEFHGFETVSVVQQVSHFHFARYLEAADAALDEAFSRAKNGDSNFRLEVTPEMQGKNHRRGNYRGPELYKGRSIAWNIRTQFYGRMEATKVKESGWYRITIKDVEAVNSDGESIWGVLRRGVGHSMAPVLTPVGLVEAAPKARTQVFETWMDAGDQLILKVDANTAGMKRTPHSGNGGSVSYKGKDRVKEGFKGIANRGILIQRIYPQGDAARVRFRLMRDFGPSDWEGLAKDKKAQLRELDQLVTRFATLAFREQLPWKVVEPYRELARIAYRGSDADLETSLRAAYRAVLCSPRFLGFTEYPGELSGSAVASRLSYMLWDSGPDWALHEKGVKGHILKRETLLAEVDRLLNHARGERFVESFADQWLDLEEIDFTTPDQRLYPTFDVTVQESMVEETRRFLAEMFAKDRSVSAFIKSDFAHLNERLVNFYRLDDREVKPGSGFQRLSISPDARSGLVTQGAILKVTADGTVTSPILRGVWMNERILGRHIPPPPPGIPAVEPDIRGATSIRDQLAKHTSDVTCAGCHAKIDPAGFALEVYDPVGLWRERYGRGDKKAAVVDPSGVTPEGDTFAGINDWRKIHAARPRELAHNLVNQLVLYGTGAAPTFADRETIEGILDRAVKNNYGARTLLREVIASDLFLTK